MKISCWASLALCFILYQNAVLAQSKSNIKFGKITLSGFDLSVYNFDSSGPSVVIVGIGDYYYYRGQMNFRQSCLMAMSFSEKSIKP